MRYLLLVFLFITPISFSNEFAETSELNVKLISDCNKLPKNGKFSTGILFNLQPGWHLYWINPGDAGLAPNIHWDLSSQITTGSIQWAFPHVIELDSISNFGYSGQLLLPVSMQTKNMTENKTELIADVNWLVCKDICIPGKAKLAKSFVVTDACEKNSNANLFADWAKKIPENTELMDGTVSIVDRKLQLELFLTQTIFQNAVTVDIFIENTQVVSYQSTQSQRWKNNWVLWKQDLNDAFVNLPEKINLVIVVDHLKSYRVQLSTQEQST